MKRHNKNATVLAGPEGFAIALDGKQVRTPHGRILALPEAALAEAVCAEWMAQGGEIRPASMPLTAIAHTALDRIADGRAATIAALLRFAETDLLCHRAEGPPELVERQDATWQPVLDWAEARFGAALAVTRGVLPLAQPARSLAALEHAVASLDDLRLAALSAAVAAMGSLVLALALAHGRLDADQAFAASDLDEAWQNERWGQDREAASRRAALRAEVEAAATVFRLHPP